MVDWSAGYVTDIGYTFGVYRELAPSVLCFSAMLAGIDGPSADQKLTYCELGCGQGYAANILAAANPELEIHAMDFNPAHIRGATSLAAAAGTSNIRFYDSSFAEFADDETLPQFDIVALHGVYSWIAPEDRAHIVRLIRKRLKIGGLAYVSYNALPGWAAAMPLRQMLLDQAQTVAGPTEARIEHAIRFVQRLADLKPAYFRNNPAVMERFAGIKEKQQSYLAHEYFNRHLNPFHHAEVARELGEAKLTYVGSAHLLDHIDAAHLTPEQQAFLGELPTGTARETVRDFLVDQQFRRDIFIRGAVQLSPFESGARWERARFVLSTPRSEISLTGADPAGKARVEEVYNPILDALVDGPLTTRDLLALPAIRRLGRASLTQALTVLVGTDHVQRALGEAGEAERTAHAKAFNRAVIERARWEDRLHFLASPVTGAGVRADRISQLFLLALREGHDHPPRFVWDVLQAVGHRMIVEDQPLQGEDANLAELGSRFRGFASRQLPVLAGLGVA
jgi:SAM-dependent methyltransferase